MNTLSKIRAFFRPNAIEVLPADVSTTCMLGIRIVAFDKYKDQWLVVTATEGKRASRCNKEGLWYLQTQLMDDTFVFTFDEARVMTQRLQHEALVNDRVAAKTRPSESEYEVVVTDDPSK